MSKTPDAKYCPHGMELAPYNMCRYCIDDKLDKIIELLTKKEGEGWPEPAKLPEDYYESAE